MTDRDVFGSFEIQVDKVTSTVQWNFPRKMFCLCTILPQVATEWLVQLKSRILTFN